MNFELAKQMLKEAATPAQREQAIQIALEKGITLGEIEQILDWVDVAQGRVKHTKIQHDKLLQARNEESITDDELE